MVHDSLLPGIPLVESPLFKTQLDAMGLTDGERQVAQALHERGFAVIDFPDPELDRRIERIRQSLEPRFAPSADERGRIHFEQRRLQDAWRYDDDVKAIAANQLVLDLLGRLYGRRAFPFQTLNFPVGTQQAAHTDAVHFSSIPERFMCGVWLAMEDISPEAGPLMYIPGSHRWPLLSNVLIGREGWAAG